MGIVIVATVHQKNKHVGYRVFDTEKLEVGDVTTDSIKKYLHNNNKLLNANISKDNKIIGVNCNMMDLPRINLDYAKGSPNYVDKPRHMLMLERTRSNTFIMVNYGGRCVTLSESNVKDYKDFLINTKPIVDTYSKYKALRQQEAAKLVQQPVQQPVQTPVQNKKRNLSDKGYADIDRDKLREQDKQLRKEWFEEELKKKSKEQEKLFEDIKSVNTIQGNGGSIELGNELKQTILNLRSMDGNLDNIIDSRCGYSVNQKLTKCALTLKETKIFYFSVYAAIQTLFVEDAKLMPTAGVTVDNMYINVNFFNDLILPEAMFLLLHELLHIILKHSLRGKGKNRDIWNIAGDLYINKLLTDEYGCPPGKGIVEIKDDNLNTGICFLGGGLWSGAVDIDNDTVEGIYEELMNDVQKKMQNKQGGGNDKQKGQEDQGSQGNQNNESGSSGAKKDKKDTQGEQDGNNVTDKVEFGNDSLDITDITFRGQKISAGSLIRDVMASSEDAAADGDQLEQKANRVLQKAQMGAKLAGAPIGEFMERYVELELAPKIRWQNLLKHYLVASLNKVTTYSRPDKRFISRGNILPGPKPLDPDKINGIKICIDTSGSISDKDIAIALGQVDQILKTYKADAEVIYWDTSVRNVGDFSTRKELLKVIPKGGGGTDINCIFEYFDSKKCKVKPKVVLVFTDGYFGSLDEKYVNKYKNNIWVVPEQDRVNFTPPNGKVAIY